MFSLLYTLSADIETTQVFGPETKTGRYKHPTSITELDNGDLYLTYYGGGGEYERETAVFGSRFQHLTQKWSRPKAIAQNPFFSMGNPVVWQSPNSRVWLFFVVRPGETWSSSRIMAKVSDDQGTHWSDAFPITWEEGTMVRSRPITLNDGSYLLPIYHETGADTEKTGADTSSLFLRFDPKTSKWTHSNKVYSRMGNLQPAAVEVSPNHLIALCRRAGDYEPGDDGFVVKTESHDGGKTWSAGIETSFPNPNAAVELIKLRNGHLLFVYNNSMNDRSPLTAALSTDNGATFPHRLNLAEGNGSYSYPTAIETEDGSILVTYTSNSRQTINLVRFKEKDLYPN